MGGLKERGGGEGGVESKSQRPVKK